MANKTRLTWTSAMDATLRVLRAQGASWEEVSETVGVSPKTARRRATTLGVATVQKSMGPIPGRKIVAVREQLRQFRVARMTKAICDV